LPRITSTVSRFTLRSVSASASISRTLRVLPCALSIQTLPQRSFVDRTVVSLNNDLPQVSTELVNLVDAEVESIETAAGESTQDFLDAFGFSLIENDDASISLQKIQDNDIVTISFTLPDDELEAEDEMDMKDMENEDPDQEQLPQRFVTLNVEIKRSSQKKQSQTVHFECAISKDKSLFIENIRAGDKTAPRLWFTELSDPLQEKMYTLLEKYGLGDRTVNFIADHVDNFKGKRATDTLNKFRDFLLSGPK